MKHIRVAASSLNQTPLDWAGNYNNIISVIDDAIKQKVDVLCLPELCITGYGCEDSFFSHAVQEKALYYLNKIRDYSKNKNIILSVGLPLAHNNTLYNVIAIISNGFVYGFVPKQNLAADGIHYEPRWFKAWPEGITCTTNDGTPIGDLIFQIDDIKLGIEICEDSWVAERTGSHLAKRGVDIILNPSASHFAFGKWETRKQLVLEGSRAFKCTYVYSNLLGNESGRAIYGGDNLIACDGKLIASNKLFSFKDYGLTTALIDVDKTKTSQIMNGSFRPQLNDLNIIFLSTNFLGRDIQKEEYDNIVETTDSFFNKKEEFSRSVSLALFDYMRKSNSKGFVVSLSGGADSSVVSCLVALMKYWGEIWLGKDGFAKKAKTSTEMKDLLTCVYQGTENSSESTYNCALWLSEDLGATFISLDIGDIVKSYTDKVSNAIGRQLGWNTDDITLQNIQARSRSPGVWMIANIKGAILLTTSNRSEAAVGYCTLDGDSSGSLNPIGGIDKAFLLEWLRSSSLYCLNNKHNAISIISEQRPTAELRPLEENQSDEQDLMPYEVLNFIEKCAIRDKKMPLEVFLTLKNDNVIKMHKFLNPHIEINDKTIKNWVRKFFTLWVRNQYKRERFAVSFHVDDESLDPKSWLRWPVLCSSLEEELSEMDNY